MYIHVCVQMYIYYMYVCIYIYIYMCKCIYNVYMYTFTVEMFNTIEQILLFLPIHLVHMLMHTHQHNIEHIYV